MGHRESSCINSNILPTSDFRLPTSLPTHSLKETEFLTRFRQRFSQNSFQVADCILSEQLWFTTFFKRPPNIAAYKFTPTDGTENLFIILDNLDPFHQLGIIWESSIVSKESKHKFKLILCELNLKDKQRALLFIDKLVWRLWDLQVSSRHMDIRHIDFYDSFYQSLWRSPASISFAKTWSDRVKGIYWNCLLKIISDIVFDSDHDLNLKFYSQLEPV